MADSPNRVDPGYFRTKVRVTRGSIFPLPPCSLFALPVSFFGIGLLVMLRSSSALRLLFTNYLERYCVPNAFNRDVLRDGKREVGAEEESFRSSHTPDIPGIIVLPPTQMCEWR